MKKTEFYLDAVSRKQFLYVKEVEFFSLLLGSVFLCIFLFSFGLQSFESYERSLGRDIHTNTYNLTIALMKLESVTDEISLNGATNKNKQEMWQTRKIIDIYHRFLLSHSISEKGDKILQSGEAEYGLLLKNVQKIASNDIFAKDDALFLRSIETSYIEKITALYEVYTSVLAGSNALTQWYAFFELLFKIALFLGLITLLYIPVIRRLKKSYETNMHMKNEIKEIAEEIPIAVHNSTVVGVESPFDDVYIVTGHKGKKYKVEYSEDKFLCECQMYKSSGSCFHILRASKYRQLEEEKII